MPEPQVAETAPEPKKEPTVDQGLKPSGDWVENEMAQLLEEEAKKEVKQDEKPEGKTEEAAEENQEGEETPPEKVESKPEDKVYTKGENGEEKETSRENIAKELLGDDIKVVDDKVVIEIQVGDKVYEADLPKVRKWAAMGVNANDRIRAANDAISQAESTLADYPQQVKAEAEKLAEQKVTQIIESISRGINPVDGQPFGDDETRQGAENLAVNLRESQLAQRLKQLEDAQRQQTQTWAQREQAQRNERLKTDAQAKTETVLTPFKQHFKTADGKFDPEFYTLFAKNVAMDLRDRIIQHRQEIGPKPDIPPEWVASETQRIAKEIFPAYHKRLQLTPKPAASKAPASALKATGPAKPASKQGDKPKGKDSYHKSWDEELEDILEEEKQSRASLK